MNTNFITYKCIIDQIECPKKKLSYLLRLEKTIKNEWENNKRLWVNEVKGDYLRYIFKSENEAILFCKEYIFNFNPRQNIEHMDYIFEASILTEKFIRIFCALNRIKFDIKSLQKGDNMEYYLILNDIKINFNHSNLK